MRNIKAAMIVILMTGCARFNTKQTDISYDRETGKPTREITTKAGTTTFFDAKSELAKFRASQTDKSQTASVGTLNNETSGTNAVAILQGMTELARALPK